MASKDRPGHKTSGAQIRGPRERSARPDDVDAIWDEIGSKHYSVVRQDELFARLRHAVEARSRSDPEAFAAEMFARMVGLVGYLSLRSMFFVGQRLAQHDRAYRSEGPLRIPTDVVETLLPRLMDVQAHLAELSTLR